MSSRLPCQASLLNRFTPRRRGFHVPLAKCFALAFVHALAVCVGLLNPNVRGSPPAANTNEIVVDLTLDQYLKLVMENNETLLAQMIESEAVRRKARAEYGVFEPELALSATRENLRRQNNSLQRSELSNLAIYEEANRTYDTAIEVLVPTGAKIHLGSTLQDLHNNIPLIGTNFSGTNLFPYQYQTFVGFTATQPLLKNAWNPATMANIRIAALDSDIAFQQYRRQLMLTVSQAEAAYWNLYFAQEQLRFFQESVSVAESILSDSRQRLDAGRSSELEVLESQSGLALRKTRQNVAVQNYYDMSGKFAGLFAAGQLTHGRRYRAVDTPQQTGSPISYEENLRSSLNENPDYLIQSQRVDQERLRLGYARNQLLPELNVKGSYGYNGLGLSPNESYDNLTGQNFPSWSVGLELRLPLGGNIKGRNNYNAARLTLEEALVNFNSVQNQIATAVDMAIRKTRSWQESLQSYETVISFNQNLLKTQIARLDVGKVEPRKVLEVEADLFDARQSFAEALVQYRRSSLELELAAGSILKSRNLDITRKELRDRTAVRLRQHDLPFGKFEPVPLPSASGTNSF
jgi:outer membrane protein